MIRRRLAWLSLVMIAAACSSKESGFGEDSGTKSGSDASGDESEPPPPDDSGTAHFGDSSSDAPSGDGGTVTTVYANTDDTLYTLNPQTNAVTMIGKFVGTSDASSDSTITDIAVNAAGDVYVNSESVIYKANVPTTPGPVMLTKIATIALSTDKFYALAFTPAGSLDPNSEILIGGDGNGELFSIDTTSGATRDLGSFGVDPGHSGYDFALSGDLVFYMDAQNNPTGLVTIRPCKPKTSTCLSTSDYLASVDMTALANAYKNNTPATTLLKGIYGGSSSSDGTGTNYGDLFGLGAWEGTVFAFARKTQANGSPLLLSIDTKTGAGNVISSSFTFTNGWSGAGVSTSTTISVPQPN